jgi:hypothetical protein
MHLREENNRKRVESGTILLEEFAYTVTKTPGHMELVAGETIHIVKYIPV